MILYVFILYIYIKYLLYILYIHINMKIRDNNSLRKITNRIPSRGSGVLNLLIRPYFNTMVTQTTLRTCEGIQNFEKMPDLKLISTYTNTLH